MAKAIAVEGLSKAYQLGDFGTGTISRDVERFIARMRGKEDPYLRIGETNDRTVKGESDIVWCLKDLNFDIEEGDAVGIIGRNGAGKSTLLKVLSRITSPTTGSVKVKGRIASLLEVGTGFHPELTGRENVYLNGAILGMRKSEIKRRFDEIVDFSGVERYIDTPVKRYSSGMYVRLAFAVAAHLESEILIVDEVLAVGDSEFQNKCLGKMGDISTGEGRTVLFVSHNMISVQKLCTKGILLSDGKMLNSADIDTVCNQYINLSNESLKSYYKITTDNKMGDGSVELRELKIINTNNEQLDTLFITTKFGFLIEYEIKDNLYEPDLSFLISTISDEKVFHVVHETGDYSIGIHKWVVWVPGNLLNNLEYKFTLGITTSNPVNIHLQHTIVFTVNEDNNSQTRNNKYINKMHGVVRPYLQWEKLN
ncbi:ABC transporter ATP-binding protein [Mucilaginibacter sp. L196]|uniref:ABC transporter ATP-binding protein n=1 Tax=Mucilaginibacter sp. L196 TaxID=1641870 RepID=UPI00131BA5D5|nr:ABC transporter ATP-binding protein [Mucilaginibacter sp. L196]